MFINTEQENKITFFNSLFNKSTIIKSIKDFKEEILYKQLETNNFKLFDDEKNIISDNRNILDFKEKTITLRYNNTIVRDHLRWGGTFETLFDILMTADEKNKIIKNILQNKHSIEFIMMFYDSLIEKLDNSRIIAIKKFITYLSSNVNGIHLIDEYLKFRPNNDDINGIDSFTPSTNVNDQLYDSRRFRLFDLHNNKSFWKNIFTNPSAKTMIEWVLKEENKSAISDINLDEMLPSYQVNKTSVDYFIKNPSKIDPLNNNFYLNTNEKSFEVIDNKLHEILKNSNMRRSYMSLYKFIKKILYNMDKYNHTIEYNDWEFIFQNEHCVDIILDKLKEHDTKFNFTKIFCSGVNIKTLVILSKFYNVKEVKLEDILEYSNIDVIKEIFNHTSSLHCIFDKCQKYKNMLNFDNIEDITYTYDFINFIKINPAILSNQYLDSVIIKFLKSSLGTQQISSLGTVEWFYLSKNKSINVIRLLFEEYSFYICVEKSEISKLSNAMMFDYMKIDRNIFWKTLCKNMHQEAIKLICLKMMGISGTENYTNKTIEEVNKEFSNYNNDNKNELNINWIDWELLSLNPSAIHILKLFEEKIVWKSIVKNKSNTQDFLNIINDGINKNKINDKNGTWDNLLANDNPCLIDLILLKVNEHEETVNWSFL